MSQKASFWSLWWQKNKWNIRSHEIPVFSLIFTIVFLIDINFCILKSIRNTLVVVSSSASSAVLPWIQIIISFPSALLAVVFFTRLNRRFRQRHIFYVTTLVFAAFFLIHAFLIYPNQDILHLPVPENPAAFTIVYSQWGNTLYHALAGLWKILILNVFFWGFTNRHLLLSEAKRFYAPVMLAGAGGGIVGGKITSFCSKNTCDMPTTIQQLFAPLAVDGFHLTLMTQSVIMAVIAVLTVLLFRKFSRMVSERETGKNCVQTQAKLAAKEKYHETLSLSSCFKFIIQDRALIALSLIVFMSYVAYNLCEMIFYDRLRAIYPDKVEYAHFNGEMTFWTGIAIAFFALFVSAPLMQRERWRILAMFTPVILLTTSGIFFFFVTFADQEWLIYFSKTIFATSPLVVGVFAGALMRSLYSAVKNTVLAAFKEVAFVTFSDEAQVKGKYIIDGLASRLGRSSSSIISIVLIALFGAPEALAPWAALVMLVFGYIWLQSALHISKHMEKNSESLHLKMTHAIEAEEAA